ncbi:MAG TPA: Fic family protein [Rhizomicrobium sp.]|nr:Fic family protein [Rhizomicrobium sp.]
MNPEQFKNSPSGRLVPTIEGQSAFVPNPLPPPKLDYARLAAPLAAASRAIGALDGLGQALPDPKLLVRSFSRVEAVASSKIEGTVTSIPELLTLEISPNAPRVRNDTREVHNYSRALRHGLHLLPNLPVSNRFFCELHGVLMEGVRDERGMPVVPGKPKTRQNWIGGRLIQNARFVPPPPIEAVECTSDLEKYINAEDGEDDPFLLIKLALIHYQFETIHPFPDGNGRVGRLILPIMLCGRKAMTQPLLYLSSYFERHNDEYIDRMFEVSRSGAWEEWIEFFLRGVAASAKNGINRANALIALHKKYMGRIQSARSSGLLAKLTNSLFTVPATTIPYAMKETKISYNAAKNNIQKLVELGIIVPEMGDDRPQWFFGTEIIATMNANDM